MRGVVLCAITAPWYSIFQMRTVVRVSWLAVLAVAIFFSLSIKAARGGSRSRKCSLSALIRRSLHNYTGNCQPQLLLPFLRMWCLVSCACNAVCVCCYHSSSKFPVTQEQHSVASQPTLRAGASSFRGFFNARAHKRFEHTHVLACSTAMSQNVIEPWTLMEIKDRHARTRAEPTRTPWHRGWPSEVRIIYENAIQILFL